MTLKEIAKEAGVSISTVSRVVNSNNPKVASKEVQDRIWEIVRKTGYTPNASAQSLKKGGASVPAHSRALACLFARTPDASNDPFFSTLARNVEIAAIKQDYIVKSSFTSFDIANPATCRMIRDTEVDGVAILGRCDKPTLKFLKQYFHSVIYTGLNEIQAGYDQILCSGYDATVSALEYLTELGHRNIGYIGETSLENRFAAFKDTLLKHGLPFRPSQVAPVPFNSNGGYQGAAKLLSQDPQITAVFCGNDTTAIGVLRALKDAGKKVPRDISVISIDDIDTAQYLSPMLTTVHIPVDEMGRTAAKVLIDRIQGGHSLPMKIHLPHYLAKRESCAPPRHL